MKYSKLPSRQSGFSLIELLVALAIGLVILTAIGAAYINSTNSTRQREDQAELNDPARIVMRLLRQNLTQAGYVDVFDLDATGRTRANGLFQPGNAVLTNVFVRIPGVPGGINTPLSMFFPGLTPVFGCDGAMVGNPQALVTAGPPVPPAPPIALACGAPNPTRHTLQIAYQGVPLVPPVPVPPNPLSSLLPDNPDTGDGRDCLQQAVPPAVPFVINRFSLSPLPTAADSSSELRCQGSGGANPQPMASGVEEFVLRYQMSAPGVAVPPGGAANPVAAGSGQAAYITAALVTASAQGWAGVTAVEICMASATPITRGAAAPGTAELQPERPTCLRGANGQFLPDVARTAGDSRLWKRFTMVVSLRNAVLATPL